MKRRSVISLLVLAVAIIYCTQYIFIAFVPNLLFAIAKYRSGKPLNTVIRAPKTDAKFRRVILPNPDFIYDACFYDATKNDILITGELADSTQYASLAFYGNNLQPYYVRSNQIGLKQHFKIRLSSVNRVRSDIISPTKQGAILLRVLVTDSAKMQQALAIQKSLQIEELEQDE